MRITYTENVFVALGIQHGMYKHHTVICCLPDSAIFFNIISLTASFRKDCYLLNYLLTYLLTYLFT